MKSLARCTPQCLPAAFLCSTARWCHALHSTKCHRGVAASCVAALDVYCFHSKQRLPQAIASCLHDSLSLRNIPGFESVCLCRVCCNPAAHAAAVLPAGADGRLSHQGAHRSSCGQVPCLGRGVLAGRACGCAAAAAAAAAAGRLLLARCCPADSPCCCHCLTWGTQRLSVCTP
jgi:hypothetical protein